MTRRRPAQLTVLTLGGLLGWTVITGVVLFIAGLVVDTFWITLLGIILVWASCVAVYRLGRRLFDE